MNFNFPFAIDKANKNRPSVTLFFAWISFALSVLAICLVPVIKSAEPAFLAIVLHTLSMTFYRMRHLDKLKLSKDSVELDGKD